MAALSNMMELETRAPKFSLPEPYTGQIVSLDDFLGKPLVVMFICNHCPYVVHLRSKLIEVAQKYRSQDVAFIGINSNDVTQYPEDHPKKMVEEVDKYGYSFPYLYDESQQVAREYDAACTPDFYLFDEKFLLQYRGQFDASRPGNDREVSGESLSHAIDRVLAGEEPLEEQQPSMGCSIKWK